MAKQVRPVVVLMLASLALIVITVNLTFVSMGIPQIAKALHSSNTGLEWIVDGYALTFACFLLVAGYLGDRFGPREVLLGGLALFSAFSVMAALATSTSELIAARCLMGIGAAGVMPMTLSLVTNAYAGDEERTKRAFGVWAGAGAATAIVSPLIAGLILAHFSWAALFWCNVPFTAAVFLAVYLVTPHFEGQRAGGFDAVGAVLSVLFAGLLIGGLIEGPQRGWSDSLVLLAFAVSALALLAFVLWERTREHPLIEVRLFTIPRFTIGVIVVATQYFVSFGQGFGTGQYLQLVLGNSALRAGVLMIPSAIVLTACSPLGPRLFARFGPRSTLTVTMVVVVLSAVATGFFTVEHGYPMFYAAAILMAIGIGLMSAPTTGMVMTSVRPEHAGMASGAQSTTRQLGGALGVAAVGSVIASVYASNLTGHLHGPAAAYLPQAKVSLANALTISHASPAIFGQVVVASRQAFASAIHASAWIVGGVAALVGLACWIVLSPRIEGAAVAGPIPDVEDLATA
jgi:MFS transporter, DHA2 family, multidrug resistance protein